MRLGTANQSALLQHSLALLTSNLFMTLAPGQTFISDQSYKASTFVNYDSRVVPDWKIPHIMTLKS